MHGKFGLLSPGKRAATVPSFFFLPFVPLCTMFFCFHTTGCEVCTFMTDGSGIFSMRTNVGACRIHEGGGKVRHKQVCTKVDSEGYKNSPSLCSTRGSNLGSSDLNGPKGGRAFWCLPLSGISWTQAVIWLFHLSICSLVLPSPVAHSVLSLFLLLTQSPSYFPEISLIFFSFRDRLFCIALVFSWVF